MAAAKIFVIGASLGGHKAIKKILSGLPNGFPIAIAIVLHLSKTEQAFLVDSLRGVTSLRVDEACDKQYIAGSNIVLAPSGYHLLVDTGKYALSIDDPVLYARPSIDVLLESAAEHYQSSAVGILLTGGGEDGVNGLREIKKLGGICLIQAPQTAENPELPQSAISAGVADVGLTLVEITQKMISLAFPRNTSI